MFVHFTLNCCIFQPLHPPNNTIVVKEQCKQEKCIKWKEKTHKQMTFSTTLPNWKITHTHTNKRFKCTFHFPEFTLFSVHFSRAEPEKNTQLFSIIHSLFCMNGVFFCPSNSVVDEAFPAINDTPIIQQHHYTYIYRLSRILLFSVSTLQSKRFACCFRVCFEWPFCTQCTTTTICGKNSICHITQHAHTHTHSICILALF